jgi:PHD/YefM family antitoxin component YafN of YafNO toxin-antitoxin module
MIELNERYITDADGKRTAVILDIATWERLLDELEDLEDIQAIYEAKQALARGEEELIPWEQVKAELVETRWATQEK